MAELDNSSSVEKKMPETADKEGTFVNAIELSEELTYPEIISTNFNDQALADIEQMALESTAFMQRIGSNLSDDEALKEALKAGPLNESGSVFSEVMNDLEELIVSFADSELPNPNLVPNSYLRILDDPAKLSVVSHTLAAYISTLEAKHLRKFATRIVSDCSLWISRLFRFFESSAYFHDDSRDGLVKISKLVLHSKYPKYDIDGFEALYTRPPVIYISNYSRTGFGQYVCSQLGLPLSCVSVVPCNTVFGSHHKMDIAALEKLVSEDAQAGKVPLMVIANAGTPIIGEVDNVQRLQDLCKKHDLWLHVEGNSLAALCLVSLPNLPAKIGDSISLRFGQWLGIPSVPYVTLFKTSDSNLIHAAGLNIFNLQMKLSCLPLWVSLRSLGYDGVVRRIKHCFELNRYLHEKLIELPNIKILSGQNVSKEAQNLGLNDVMNKTLSTSVLFEILFPTVVFQFNPKSSEEEEISQSDRVYYDNLNSWLAQVLLRDVSKINVDFMEIEEHGVIIRYCPLEHAHVANTTQKDIDDLISSISIQVGIINATVIHKKTFAELVGSKASLQLVDLSNWVGLGGVRYIPELWVDRLSELPDSGKEEVNKLNIELVTQLKNSDSAFSVGEGVDGLECVRFGMVTEDTDMEELINLVEKTGKEIEESSKFLENMAELVRRGISAANEDLEKENEERLMQEGVLRHVPLVGSFVNWWSPMPKEVGMRGRSFNLQSGSIESTENIYKYHMQIQHRSSHEKDKIVAVQESSPQEKEDSENGNSTASSPIEHIDPKKEFAEVSETTVEAN